MREFKSEIVGSTPPTSDPRIGRPIPGAGWFLLASAVACLLGPITGSVRAGMIVESQSFGTATSPLAVPGLPVSLNFARFDASQGTLVSVQVQLSGNASVAAYAQSQQSQSQTINQLIAGVGLDLNDPSLNLLSSANAEAAVVSSPTTIAGFATQTYGPQSATASDTETYTSGTELTEFIGTGQISLLLGDGALAEINQAPFGLPLLFGPSSDTVYGSVSITYTFAAAATAAPEPASATLMLSAAGGLLGLRLFRRR
jgi:hypothetical protein